MGPADPAANIKNPNRIRARIIGASQNFLRIRKKAQSSLNNSISFPSYGHFLSTRCISKLVSIAFNFFRLFLRIFPVSFCVWDPYSFKGIFTYNTYNNSYGDNQDNKNGCQKDTCHNPVETQSKFHPHNEDWFQYMWKK